MNPRRLRTTAEKENLRRLLLAFYRKQPPTYDLMNRPQSDYDRYASLIGQHGPMGGRVLDFGCGTFRSPATIAGRGFMEVVGCDLSFLPADGDPPGSAAPPAIRLVALQGIALPFPDEHFDVVSSLCVFEHLIDVEEHLRELHRVLRPGGVFVLVGPNWSGLNNPIKALFVTLVRRSRYWLYETAADAAAGIVRVFLWYMEVLLSPSPRFLLIAPRMKQGTLFYEESDDDCVHLCQPLSFKRWLRMRGYALVKYNRFEGKSVTARIFNTLFPSLATTNMIVARKPVTQWVHL